MISNYDTLLFDLDGTLTDSNEGILRCLENAIKQMGFEIPEDTNKFLGPPIRQSFSQFLGMDEKQIDEAVKIFRERYSTVGLFENRVYEGIPEMLERLKKVGKRLMVATASLRSTQSAYLKDSDCHSSLTSSAALSWTAPATTRTRS